MRQVIGTRTIMKPKPNVGKDIHNPNYDVKLSELDTEVEVGLILCDNQGKTDRRGITQSAMPRTAMQMAQGGGAYDNYELPFIAESATTMIGGRGIENFVKDKTRYADGFRMDTSGVYPLLGPAVIPQTNYEFNALNYNELQVNTSGSGLMPMVPTADKTTEHFVKFENTTGEPLIIRGMTINAEITSEAQNIDICYGMVTNMSGNKITLPYEKSIWMEEGIMRLPHGSELLRPYTLYFDEPVTIPNGGIVYYGFAPTDTIQTFMYSWTAYAENSTRYMLGDQYPNSSFFCSLLYESINQHQFFEYNRGLYMLKHSLPMLKTTVFMNGYRGIAGNNTGNKDKLITGRIDIPAGSLKGCVVLITNGPGELEKQNWRDIVDNNSFGEITVSEPWNIAHSPSSAQLTEYVILGTNVWSQVIKLSQGDVLITDVLQVNDYLVFAYGNYSNLTYYKEIPQYKDDALGTVIGGSYDGISKKLSDTTPKDRFDFLALGQSITGDLQIWGANADSCQVSYAKPIPFEDINASGNNVYPIFDIWREEREELNITIDRLTADIGDEDDEDQLKYLTRAKEDAIRERDKLLTYVQAGNTSSHITNMVIYGTPGMPFILKESELGSIFQNVYSKIPIGELESVRSEVNGRAAMAYGVYLYFNLEGGWIERYYDQQMTDVSPNKNEGLPANRQGDVSKLMPYAGRWYASYDAGNEGYSHILLNNELGWHEIYRSPVIGLRITDIYVQALPGKLNPDLLWVSESNNIFAIPISITPLQQKNYGYYGDVYNRKYGNEMPYIETAWIDFNYQDVNKFFHSLKLFVDMPNKIIRHNYEYFSHVWYQTENMGPNEWVFIGTGNSENRITEFLIVDQFNRQTVTGKNIKFKIALQTADKLYTPRLKAWVCNAVIRFEVKKSWDLSFFLQPDTDLIDQKIIMDPDAIYQQLERWANSVEYPKPLRMNTNDPVSDGKLVFIDPAAIRKTVAEYRTNTGGAKKNFINIGTIRLYEV